MVSQERATAQLDKDQLAPAIGQDWILLLGAVLTPVYMLAMLRPTARSGVYAGFPSGPTRGNRR
jgi:hypothetical protein